MFSRLQSFLTAWTRRERFEVALDEELRFHLEAYAEDLVRSGVPRREAVRRARIHFGSVEGVKDDCRRARGLWFVDECRQDLRYALRGLFRQPGFSFTATFTLALGLGLVIGLFAVVDAVLLRPLPFADQEELVVMWEKDDSTDNPHIEVSLPNFEDWRAQAGSFVDMAAMGSTTWGEVEVREDPPGPVDHQRGLGVVLRHARGAGAPRPDIPAGGRRGRGAARGGAEPHRVAAVLRHESRRGRVDRAGRCAARAVHRGRCHAVRVSVSVRRRGVDPGRPGVGWHLPPERDGRRRAARPRGSLRDSTSGSRPHGGAGARGDGRHRAGAVGIALLAVGGTRRVAITSLTDYIFGSAEAALFVLLGGGTLLLLIACANVTGLMIVRSQSRRRDVAVQCALGIGRGRLFRAHLTEMLLVTGAAAAGGIAFASAALPILVALGPGDMPRLEQAGVNGTAVALGALLAIAFGLAMTVAASPRPAALSLVGWLREGARSATAGRAGTGARNMLIVSQVAMALLLTIGAGLLTSSYVNLAQVDLVAGRTFTDRDTTDAPAAVMVSESLARYLWPSGDAVGRRLIAVGAEAESDDAPAWQTVVGVVEDARYRELERGRFDLYVPFTQVSMGLNHLVIRTLGDPARLGAAIRAAVRRADPNFVIDSIAPLRGLVDDVMRPWRFNMTMATLLAGLATGLAAIGLFATVAYGVTRRTWEIGVRRALGAQAVDVLRLVWGQAVLLTLLGAAIGLGVALLAAELLRPLLFGVVPREAGTFAGLTALLLAVCAAASLLAAWRATRIDPLVALRESE